MYELNCSDENMIDTIQWNFIPIFNSLKPMKYCIWLPISQWYNHNDTITSHTHIDMSRASCPKGPTLHAYAWQIGPFWQDTIDVIILLVSLKFNQQDIAGKYTLIWYGTK